MNIFVTNNCPIKSAIILDDKRLVKMTLETTQLLSTTLSILGSEKAPYKKTHKNHPCTIWVTESRGNYLWLLNHLQALLQEYTKRYNKVHKCQNYIEIFTNESTLLTNNNLTPFKNVSYYKDDYTTDITILYQRTLVEKWLNNLSTTTWNKQHKNQQEILNLFPNIQDR